MTSPSLFYREIELTQGQVALVDVEDYEWLMQWKWHAQQDSKVRGSFYADRWSSPKDGGNKRKIKMHCAIAGVVGVDHKNHNPLDNRRNNLRSANARQQAYNRRISKRNTTGFKGLKVARSGRYIAGIRVNGKQLHLGTFDTKIEAAMAYNAAAVLHHGEFACLNIIA